MTTRIKYIQEKKETKNWLWKTVWVSLLAMVTTAAANLGLYAAASQLFPDISSWPGVGIGQIIGAGNGYLTLGAVAFVIIMKNSSQPKRDYLLVATFGLLLSLILPISAGLGFDPSGAPAASIATVITLSLMHLLSYMISVPMFIRMVID